MIRIDLPVPETCCTCPCSMYNDIYQLMRCRAAMAKGHAGRIAVSVNYSDAAGLTDKIKKPEWCPIEEVEA